MACSQKIDSAVGERLDGGGPFPPTLRTDSSRWRAQVRRSPGSLRSQRARARARACVGRGLRRYIGRRLAHCFGRGISQPRWTPTGNHIFATPPETPLGECAPDRPHLRPLQASAKPDPPIRLGAQVRQNCYTCAPLCALRLYVTCCITGRIAIKKVHKNHRRISRSSAGMQPGVGKLEK